MKLQIQSVHFTADQSLLDFLQRKLDKLDTFFDRIVSGEVILRVQKPESHDNKLVEVKLFVPGATLFCKEEAGTFETATDKAVEDMKKQLIKYKEKLISY
ncbi:ribosome hibernation-promoting factor, HPF/YfiA family [Rufibacter glacialis]|uniref:Ribosome hibernation-promoting factor, HPF/YfiA family n=1 Tax=Rufibacter glacialis TaxID=1259555 RepID=A0A5M8QM55_9BACT|nr:ribosome-associated translation inhibitor RaiA [Rufibacter glacialis]KAA6437225.1 ribosome-associated translation inhibitor RaiA [Rufibacter glacialis]GGK60974.1 RNA polymerase subunit sigma-54 [Rufibacter glacialis]